MTQTLIKTLQLLTIKRGMNQSLTHYKLIDQRTELLKVANARQKIIKLINWTVCKKTILKIDLQMYNTKSFENQRR